MAVQVQLAGTEEAPWSAHRPSVLVADPESGRILLAVNAKLQGIRLRTGQGGCQAADGIDDGFLQVMIDPSDVSLG
jgi:hypothetical protein